MTIRLKDWHIYTLAALLAAFSMFISFVGTELTVPASANEGSDEFVIILDPGHGGVDGGAVGAGGTVEKRINLEISLRLRDILADAGYTVIMTRCEDISIHDSSADTIKEQKVSDMHNRLELTRLYPNSMLVSIHQNTLSDPAVTGAQVFFSPNNEKSAVLAQSIQDAFNAGLQPDAQRVTKEAGKNLYLFYNAQNTAVLCECGFLSNPEEEKLLCSQEYQDRVSFCIYSGILSYLAAESAAKQ